MLLPLNGEDFSLITKISIVCHHVWLSATVESIYILPQMVYRRNKEILSRQQQAQPDPHRSLRIIMGGAYPFFLTISKEQAYSSICDSVASFKLGMK